MRCFNISVRNWCMVFIPTLFKYKVILLYLPLRIKWNRQYHHGSEIEVLYFNTGMARNQRPKSTEWYYTSLSTIHVFLLLCSKILFPENKHIILLQISHKPISHVFDNICINILLIYHGCMGQMRLTDWQNESSLTSIINTVSGMRASHVKDMA